MFLQDSQADIVHPFGDVHSVLLDVTVMKKHFFKIFSLLYAYVAGSNIQLHYNVLPVSIDILIL